MYILVLLINAKDINYMAALSTTYLPNPLNSMFHNSCFYKNKSDSQKKPYISVCRIFTAYYFFLKYSINVIQLFLIFDYT